MILDRRGVLQALSAFAASTLIPAPARAASGTTVSVAQFARLSSALTGFPPGDPAVAAKLLAAFATPSRRADVARLARVTSEHTGEDLDAAIRANGLDPLAKDLVSAWYSGVVGGGESARLVLYAEALVWSAMTYSKPMGFCGGPPGYWASPPQ
jgi:hypothetical protein